MYQRCFVLYRLQSAIQPCQPNGMTRIVFNYTEIPTNSSLWRTPYTGIVYTYNRYTHQIYIAVTQLTAKTLVVMKSAFSTPSISQLGRELPLKIVWYWIAHGAHLGKWNLQQKIICDWMLTDCMNKANFKGRFHPNSLIYLPSARHYITSIFF